MYKKHFFLMNEIDEHGGDGGAGSSNEPNSILAGGGFENEEKPPVNDENKEEGKEEKQGEYDWLPEKFRVQTSDGLELDLKASAEKMAASYDGLSKRLGTGDVPPKSADEYKVDLGETVNFDEFKKDPDTKEFLEEAQKAGLTNKQVEFVLQKYVAAIPKAVGAFKESTIETAQAELSDTWKTEQEFKTNINNAQAAFNRYASPDDKAKIDEIGNNPIVIRLLANIGKGLQEDQPAGQAQGIQQPDAKKLMQSEAYRNPNHPDHKATHAQVQRYYQSTYGNTVIS